MSKKKIIIVILLILIILAAVVFSLYLIDSNKMKQGEPVLFSTWGKKYAPKEKENADMNIVLSLEDKISDNSVWCGTFNLIWNDLKNDLAKQDIEFTPQLDIVKNLNKGTFNTSHLSENSYYKVYGHPNEELKKTIEKAIKDKFNETSNILDDFDWKNRGENDYFLYSMLKKEFEFTKEFTEFKNGRFGKYENVKYFGINNSTNESVREQVSVLYYNSDEDFAIKLNTKTNDEVIIAKGLEAQTFMQSYEKIQEYAQKYSMTSVFEPNINKNEEVKIPNISFNLKKEIKEVENKPFLFSNGLEYEIEKAMQTIEFDLDKKGGKIKSEAGMMNKESIGIPDIARPRKFVVDDTFTIFLKENDKELPYFAATISDISKVQSGVELEK